MNVKRLNKITWITILLGLCTGCGSASDQSEAWKSIGNINFDSSFNSTRFKLFQDDIKLLDSIDPTDQQEKELKQILKLSEISPTSLRSWLEERVKYVVSEDFTFKDKLKTSTPDLFSVYPLSSYHTDFFSAWDISGNHTFSASNPGSNLFDYCEEQQMVCVLEIDGIGTLPVRSPRVGIVQIHNALFSPLQISGQGEIKNRNQEDILYRIHRLSTLFHEARHSDGNKDSKGVPENHPFIKNDKDSNIIRKGTRNFVHVMCPKNSPLKDQYACDLNLNGPYKIQSLIAQMLASSCKDCSKDTLTLIGAYIAQLNDRIVNDGATFWDETPEMK